MADSIFTANPFKGLPKPARYAVIIGALGIGGYFVYRHHQSTGSWNPWSSAPASTSATGIDPVTNLPYAQDNVTDPATGETYLAEAQQYGSVAAAEAAVSAYGQSSPTGSGIGANPASGTTGSGGTTVVTSSTYTSNAAWSQAVQQGLEAISGSTSYDGTDIGSALGAFLDRQALSPEQANLIQTALAEYGNPPVGTYTIIREPAKKPGNGGSGGSGGNKKPEEKAPETAPDPLTFSTSSNALDVSFPAVGGADKYQFDFSNHHTAVVKVTSGKFSVKTVGKKGTFKVRAGNAHGWGPYGASKSFEFPDKG